MEPLQVFAQAESAKKMHAIFEHASWLKESKNAVHMPVSGMDKNHQFTWRELHEMLERYEYMRKLILEGPPPFKPPLTI